MMKDILDKIDEATYVGAYPSDGSGVATDDDLPPGTFVFGDKMVPVNVPNRLTGATKKYVTADDLNQDWNYNEFDNSKSMGSLDSYSDTLKDLKGALADRLWKHVDTNASDNMHPDKEEKFDDSEVDQDSKLSDDEEEVVQVKESILEKIDKWTKEPKHINEAEIAGSDRKALTKIIMSGKSSKIKIKSLNLDVTVRNDDGKVDVIYSKNDDFTMSLVEIADAMGFSFTTGKNGKNFEFTFNLD